MKVLQLVLFFQCLIAQLHHTFSPSTKFITPVTQFSFTRQGVEGNGTECPSVWYKYNWTTQDCQCIPFKSLTCNGEHAYSNIHHILTYDANRGVVTEIEMYHNHVSGYNKTDRGHAILLPNNISELNTYMCGPLNRKHYMCKDCKNGYGPAATYQSVSCASMCYLCKDTWRDLLIHLSLDFIPLTGFYLLILIFQIRLTSAPMTCFIMYSQLVVLVFYDACGLNSSNTTLGDIKFSDIKGTLRRETKIILTLYGVFNLDFFHYIQSPFCISSKLRPIHVFCLGYISAFYLFLLVLLTWLCIKLHGCNFRPIVCLWKPFHGCFVRLRRGWNTKSDLIDVFASFFLLTYCKILYQIVLTFDFEGVTNYSLTMRRVTHSYILTADFSINTFNMNNYFILLVSFTIMLILFFIIFPLVLLFFYPTKVFRNLLSKCCSNRFRIFLNIFIEKFQCCYRDGLDGGRDMRSLSGMYFLLRIISGPICKRALEIDSDFFRGLILSVVTLHIALSRPYKKKIG